MKKCARLLRVQANFCLQFGSSLNFRVRVRDSPPGVVREPETLTGAETVASSNNNNNNNVHLSCAHQRPEQDSIM